MEGALDLKDRKKQMTGNIARRSRDLLNQERCDAGAIRELNDADGENKIQDCRRRRGVIRRLDRDLRRGRNMRALLLVRGGLGWRGLLLAAIPFPRSWGKFTGLGLVVSASRAFILMGAHIPAAAVQVIDGLQGQEKTHQGKHSQLHLYSINTRKSRRIRWINFQKCDQRLAPRMVDWKRLDAGSSSRQARSGPCPIGEVKEQCSDSHLRHFSDGGSPANSTAGAFLREAVCAPARHALFSFPLS